MSDNRKILVAKRKNGRSYYSNRGGQNFKSGEADFRRGAKRPGSCGNEPKKNFANDRLKRLRTSLNEEATKTSSGQKTIPSASASRSVYKVNVTRKRPFNECTQQAISVKLSEEESEQSSITPSSSNAFVFKEEYLTQRKFFGGVANPRGIFTQTTGSAESTEAMEWSTTDDLVVTTNSTSSNVFCGKIRNQFVIVVDTNIFLSHLQIIKDIVNMTIEGDTKPVIHIPWIVVEELDFMKQNNNKTRFKAQEAIKYIERTLSTKHDKMRGQTLDEVNEQKSVGPSPDNQIIACCMQVSEKYENVVLLTADINLKNKAHFNNIPVCSHTEILSKISTLNYTKVDAIMRKMTNLCRLVIEKCAESAYGSACSKMPICHPPPKTLQECIYRFTKYWSFVFQELLMKQFKKSIDDLSIFLMKYKTIRDTTNEINELLRLCVRVCLFLKDVECCKDTIEDTIRDLNSIKES